MEPEMSGENSMFTTQNRSNRRDWLTSVGAAAIGGTLVGCGSRNSGGMPVLKVFNWSDYIAEDVIPEFEQRTGCRVVYDNYSSDSELEARLATGGGAYDVIFPSDRAMQALLAKDLLQPLDHRELRNLRHLDPKWLDPPCDPGNRHSAAYFWGTVAVGIRPDRVAGRPAGFEALFDPAHQGRITMLDDAENVVAATLLKLGRPMNSVAPADLAAAQGELLKQKPLVQAYTSDAYKERLISGDAWASLGWSGDLIQAADVAAEEQTEIRVVVPVTGTMIWLDSMAIPRAARNVELAHELIDFLLDPSVAMRNAEFVHYPTPNRTALKMLPAAAREDANVYPPAATLARCQWLKNRGAEIGKIEAVWRVVKS
jgi:spermidine/putrescine transport system substrate-binding protein